MNAVVTQRISELKSKLIPQLQEYVTLFNISEETLRLIASLPPGTFSYFHGTVKLFGENKYVPDYIQGLNPPKSQYQLFSLLSTIKGSADVSKKKTLVYCFLDKDAKLKAIWLDCRTQNHSIYLGALGIYAKESTAFVQANFFPNKI